MTPLTKPAFCDCGNPAVGKKWGHPVCQRCHDWELRNIRHHGSTTRMQLGPSTYQFHKYAERFSTGTGCRMKLRLTNAA